MEINNIQPEMSNQKQSKENWTKPEVNLLSVNENTLGGSTQPGADATVLVQS